MRKAFTDRSRTEAYQRCKRLRFLEYHQNGMGITSSRKPLPLAVGGAVHTGLAVLLELGARLYESELRDQTHPVTPPISQQMWSNVEHVAVVAALADFSKFKAALDVDTAETSLNLPDADQRSSLDTYLYAEQSALVEGLVRAYARRRLRPLLEQFEVLEVEREGQWLLSSWDRKEMYCGELDVSEDAKELYFMSRPDALLLERQSRQLYLESFKTTSGWDVRKERDAQHDMQGLSEGVEIERRLADWWEMIHHETDAKALWSDRMGEYLRSLDEPPRILAVRYEYMLKGDRWRDKDLSQTLGMGMRTQRSLLVRGYANVKADGRKEDERGEWNCSWEYLKPDGTGEQSKLNYRTWKSEPVWPHMPIAKWIDLLDASAETVSGDTGAVLGYKSEAQTTGYLASHPLDDIFLPPMVVYRNEDELRDWVDQVEAQERTVVEHVAAIEAEEDEGERRHLLNIHFPQSRRACFYPTECSMTKICYGGDDIRRDPLGSGLYQIRKANHPQEVEVHDE